MGTFNVPTINIAAFTNGKPEQRRAIAAQVDRAAREVGFMQIAGHGIPDSAILGLTEAMDGFFGQSMHEKQKWQPPSVDINRGYSGPKTERLSYSLGVASAADLFEAFNIGAEAKAFPELHLSEQDYPANLWPDHPYGFEEKISTWFAEAGGLARRLTKIFALALGLPEDYFVPFQGHSVDTLRLNNYHLPPDSLRLEPDQMGMGAHTDYGIVTVLWADRVLPGLQIMDGDGGWHDVMPAPGALLINLGDVLSRWTNDRWISTMHRVSPPIAADGKAMRRRSAAYFHDGNADAVIACLPGCADAEHPALYEPVTVSEHLTAKLGGSRGLKLNEDAEREAARLTGTSEALAP